MRLAGIDFTSAPTRRKPIVVATGRLARRRLTLDAIEPLASMQAFDAWLATPGPWLGGFDFPFGLPREFVAAHALGETTAAVIAEVRSRWPTRMAWRAAIDAWGNARPAGSRLVHRATDRAASVASTSPLQSRYVPVAFMYYEGVARLVEAGVEIAGLHAGDASRVALEAYPRRLAHALVGPRSYKNADLDDRRDARSAIVAGLASDRLGLGFVVDASAALGRTLVADASGDRLDALLCLVQAAAASALPNRGLPSSFDRVEGWIVG